MIPLAIKETIEKVSEPRMRGDDPGENHDDLRDQQ